MAEIIRNRRILGVSDDDVQLINYNEIGKDWVAHFMSHHPQLESARRKCIEMTRIKNMSSERLKQWFEDLQNVIKEYDIELGNIYNMYESGFAIDDVETSLRIINAMIHQKFQAKFGHQEWITAVECIYADGSPLPPLIIFKGEEFIISMDIGQYS